MSRFAIRRLVAPAVAALTSVVLIGCASMEVRPSASLTKPKENWGEIFLVEIGLPGARPDTSDYYCPPDMNWETDICFGQSIVYRRGQILDVLAASPGARLSTMRPRVKGLGPHAARRVDPLHAVALIEETDGGYWWMPFAAEIERGRFCLPKHFIEQFEVTISARVVPSEDWQTCYRI